MPTTTAISNARSITYFGNQMKIHLDAGDTGGRLAVIESVVKPGSEPPVHVHEREDETFIVLDGEVKLMIAGEEFILRRGDSKFAPRNVPHTFKVMTPTAHTLGIITPAGFEDFFRILADAAEAPSYERVGEVAAQFGVRIG